MLLTKIINYFRQKCVGLHFGRFFNKLISHKNGCWLVLDYGSRDNYEGFMTAKGELNGVGVRNFESFGSKYVGQFRDGHQGPILQSSASAENFSASNFGQSSTLK
jgi:hypothetical protein